MKQEPSPAIAIWPASIRLPRITREFLYRAGLTAIFVTVTHQLRWEWLRFLTSETILRLTPMLGMATARVSLDTISVQGQLFQFVISCTFVDVYLGSIPLLWNLQKPFLRNLLWLFAVGLIFFGVNVVRLEIGHILYTLGLPWTVADEVLGGFAYFGVWLFLWRQRSWELTAPSAASALGKNPVGAS